MSANGDSVAAMRRIRNALEQNKYLMEFCTVDNFYEAIGALSEDLEAFDGIPLFINADDLKSFEGLKNSFVILINATWHLIHKHRGLLRLHETLKEERSRISSDNSSLSNQIKRLREVILKKDSALNEMQERERQLQVKVNNLSREVKREREEALKLKKQMQSREDQHAHEIRRIQLSGNKLREQLQKTVGTCAPREKFTSTSRQTEQEKKIRLCQQTINRLEENNSVMMQEINDLRQELALHVNGVELHMESSGLWNETTT
ncbi:afadin- and alpha-actinin-binding protein [Fopius arisanus]|uniref:Afadin- and alpha-actinin-binding protein n=2 Tax=Fopius arisanus TaxID=64838 RepID=A0A9R1TQI7_9HYME|nr:PREDICTED: afadin- and alpha-actinin-binding protein-like [Fopius arisanus]